MHMLSGISIIFFPIVFIHATPSVSFYLSLDSVILHYPATNKKKRREYYSTQLTPLLDTIMGVFFCLA
jgi:hypothetical protein